MVMKAISVASRPTAMRTIPSIGANPVASTICQAPSSHTSTTACEIGRVEIGGIDRHQPGGNVARTDQRGGEVREVAAHAALGDEGIDGGGGDIRTARHILQIVMHPADQCLHQRATVQPFEMAADEADRTGPPRNSGWAR